MDRDEGVGSGIAALPADLLSDPLRWFFAEHQRHLRLCQIVDDLAADPVFDADRMAGVVDFLRYEAPVHIIDEEEDLFPLLRRRARSEDAVEQVLGRLSAEHKADRELAAVVRAHLEACLADRRAAGLDPAKRDAMTSFASHERRHLALENAVVLPIARLRLTSGDLGGLARRLAARRGRLLPATP